MKPHFDKHGPAARAAVTSGKSYLLIASLIGVSLAALAWSQSARSQESAKIKVLSSQPDRVSGGDALVEISGSSGLAVSLNGKDDTSAFHPGAKPGTLVGLVDGLKLGKNQLKVSGGATGSLGAHRLFHQGPDLFRRADWKPPSSARPTRSNFPAMPRPQGPRGSDAGLDNAPGTTLGKPIDADCSIKTRVDYVYMSKTAKKFDAADRSQGHARRSVDHPPPPPAPRVPYIVRVAETGTMNRGIYQNAILFNPLLDAAADALLAAQRLEPPA